MDRRRFLRFLGIGAATAAVTPKFLAETEKVAEYTCDDWLWEPLHKPSTGLDGFIIYEEPMCGYDYSIGVDTGNGFNSPSCISVMRKGKDSEPDVQAAEFVSEKHNSASLVPVVAAIARKYGVACKDQRGPMIVIEQIASAGDTTQHQLKLMGFTRFFQMMEYRSDKPKRSREGWYSNAWSHPILMTRFTEAVLNGDYHPKSSELISDVAVALTKELPENSRFTAASLSYIGLFRGFRQDA